MKIAIKKNFYFQFFFLRFLKRNIKSYFMSSELLKNEWSNGKT